MDARAAGALNWITTTCRRRESWSSWTLLALERHRPQTDLKRTAARQEFGSLLFVYDDFLESASPSFAVIAVIAAALELDPGICWADNLFTKPLAHSPSPSVSAPSSPLYGRSPLEQSPSPSSSSSDGDVQHRFYTGFDTLELEQLQNKESP